MKQIMTEKEEEGKRSKKWRRRKEEDKEGVKEGEAAEAKQDKVICYKNTHIPQCIAVVTATI